MDLYDDRYFDVYAPLYVATASTTVAPPVVSTSTDTFVTVSTSTSVAAASSTTTDGAP